MDENGNAAGKIKKRSNHSAFVPETGFEPARRFQRYHLKVVRLPISPPGYSANVRRFIVK